MPEDRTEGKGIIRLALGVPAVERLLKDNNELEVYLRDQVKEQVFKNHIGRIMSEANIKEMTKALEVLIETVFRAEAEKQIGEMAKGRFVGQQTINFTPAFLEAINIAVTEFLRSGITNMVNVKGDALMKMLLENMDQKISAYMDRCIEARIEKGIQERLKRAAEG